MLKIRCKIIYQCSGIRCEIQHSTSVSLDCMVCGKGCCKVCYVAAFVLRSWSFLEESLTILDEPGFELGMEYPTPMFGMSNFKVPDTNKVITSHIKYLAFVDSWFIYLVIEVYARASCMLVLESRPITLLLTFSRCMVEHTVEREGISKFIKIWLLKSSFFVLRLASSWKILSSSTLYVGVCKHPVHST